MCDNMLYELAEEAKREIIWKILNCFNWILKRPI